jgi:cell division ATPase FtsA
LRKLLFPLKRKPLLAAERKSVYFYSLVDIGADSIKAAVISTRHGLTHLGNGLVPAGERLLEGGRAEVAALVNLVNQALKQAEDNARSNTGEYIIPDDVLFAMPPRLCWGELFSVRTLRDQPTAAIGKGELLSLKQRADRLAKQRLPKLDNEDRGPLVALTASPAGIFLDGRQVVDPVGFKGKELLYQVYGISGLAGGLRALRFLADSLELNMAGVVSPQQSLGPFLREPEALLCEIGAAGTYISVYQQNAVVATRQFRLGGGYFSLALSRSLDLIFIQAEALKKEFSLGHLPEEESRKIAQALKSPLNRWGDELFSQLRTMEQCRELPGRIYLAGGGALLPGLPEAIKALSLRAEISFKHGLEIKTLGPTGLPGIKECPSGERGLLLVPALSLASAC